MCDVLHFHFEEDNYFNNEESYYAKSRLRTAIFRDMYGIKYRYAYEPSTKRDPSQKTAQDYEDEAAEWGTMSDDEALQPFNPRKEPQKPDAQAPTEFDIDAENPFPGLDAPMN